MLPLRSQIRRLALTYIDTGVLYKLGRPLYLPVKMSPSAVSSFRAQSMLPLLCEFSWLHSCPAHWWELYWRYTQQDSSEVPSPCLGSCLHAEVLSLGPHLSCTVACPCLPTYSGDPDPGPGPHPGLSILTADFSVTVYLSGDHRTLAYLAQCLQSWSSRWLADTTSWCDPGHASLLCICP